MHSVYYDIVIIRMDKGFTSGFLYVVMEKNYYSAIRSDALRCLDRFADFLIIGDFGRHIFD